MQQFGPIKVLIDKFGTTVVLPTLNAFDSRSLFGPIKVLVNNFGKTAVPTLNAFPLSELCCDEVCVSLSHDHPSVASLVALEGLQDHSGPV